MHVFVFGLLHFSIGEEIYICQCTLTLLSNILILKSIELFPFIFVDTRLLRHPIISGGLKISGEFYQQ